MWKKKSISLNTRAQWLACRVDFSADIDNFLLVNILFGHIEQKLFSFLSSTNSLKNK